MKRSSKQCMIVLWNLMKPRDSERNLCSPKNHEDHIASEGFISMSQYNMHKFIPMPQAMKILDAKAAEHKEWKKLEEKVKSKKDFILEAQRDKKKVHFTTLVDMCHLKKRGVRTKITHV